MTMTTDPGTTAEPVPAPMSDSDLDPVPARRRISARVRILLWLLLVMAVALAAVATTTRSILLRDVDSRVSGLLAQEAGEFANFEERGVDPATGRAVHGAGAAAQGLPRAAVRRS